MSKSRKRTAELLSFSGFGKFVELRIPDVSFVKSVEVLILSAFPLFFCFLKVCYSGVTSLFMKLPHCAGMVRGLKIIDNRRKRIRKLRKKNKSKQIALS